MANIDILKTFEEIEFVKDSAVCQVLANEYVVTGEEFSEFEFEVVDDIAPGTGMKFEILGITIEWWSLHNATNLGYTNNNYYAFVEDTDSGTNFSFDIQANRIVMALQSHPNFETFSKYAEIVYYGSNIFKIRAIRSDVVIKKHLSFSLAGLSGPATTWSFPVDTIVEETTYGTLNIGVTPYELSGAVESLRADFRLIVDVSILDKASIATVVSENYYPDAKGFAEIDIAGIVTRFFEREDLNGFEPNNLNSFYYYLNALKKAKIKISSYFDNAIQTSVYLDTTALNAYTGKEDKSNHTSEVKQYWKETGYHKWLTALPTDVIILNAEFGIILNILLYRKLNQDGITALYDGYSDTTKLHFVVYYKNNAQDYIDRNIDVFGHTETECVAIIIKRETFETLITGNWDDINFISVQVRDTVNTIGSTILKLNVNNKSIGNERLFLFKNRFGQFERMIAKGANTTSMAMEKKVAHPFKAWNGDAANGNIVTYANESQNKGFASIGFLGKEYREFLKDFLNSTDVFEWRDNAYVAITIEDGSYDLESSLENLKSLEFEYSYNLIKRT